MELTVSLCPGKQDLPQNMEQWNWETTRLGAMTCVTYFPIVNCFFVQSKRVLLLAGYGTL
jgi:hypothetical protein